jgi:prepilin-type processing-associated H-X9-DG protein
MDLSSFTVMNSDSIQSPVTLERLTSQGAMSATAHEPCRIAPAEPRAQPPGAGKLANDRQFPLQTSVPGRSDVAAFTLIELLAVLAVLVIGILLLVPALAHTKPDIHAFQCSENLRRLQNATTMYSHDNHDLFPPNPDDSNSIPGYNWAAGDAGGGMPPGSFGYPSEATNPEILANPALDLLAIYIGGNIGLFKCPSDPRYGPYGGTNASLEGTIIPVIRSVSMNQGVGTIDPVFSQNGGGHGGKPVLPVNGPWLTGFYHANTAASGPYATFGRMTDFSLASPADIFVLVEENPWSINDAALAVIAGRPTLTDYPASYHNNGASFSFADGHVESHHWLSPVMTLANYAGQTSVASGTPGFEDWYWLASHATRNIHTGTVP